ncbi:hypothetical protein PFFCH_00116 [Plasmodium falciparum FCH/4]|uniref:Uncharacterized protein n=1 Tax=Plasmodium falciparum FCH/4 TaxID=1036724 RepID=A0A024VUP9_PLAFA|nr:hypothetical protein PFFCH_00116 [Plasmodium falciparum FCH/4]
MISFETFLLLNGETLKCYSFFEHVLTYYISKKLINIFYGKYGKYYNIEICSCEELSVENLFYSKSINFGDSTEKKKKGDKDIWDFFSQIILRKREKKKKNIKTSANYKKKQNYINDEYNTTDRKSNHFNICKNDKYVKNHITHNICKNYNCHENMLYYQEYKELYNAPEVIWNYYLLKILYFLYKKLLYHDVYYHHYNNIKKKKKKHINIKYCKDLYEEAIITHFYKLKYLDIQKLYNNHFFHIHIYREKKKKPILIICKKSLYFFNHIYLNYLRIYNYSNPISFNTEKKKIIKSNYQIKCINSFKELKMFNIKDYTLLYIILKYYDIHNNNNNRKQNNTFEILYILLKKIITQRYFSNNLQFLFKSFFSINRFNFIPTLIKQYLIHFIYKFFYCHHEKKKKFPYVLPSLTCNPLMLKFEYVKRCAITTTNIKKIGNRTKLQAATIKKKKPTTVITTYRMITYNCKREKKNLYIKLIYYTTLCVYISLLHNNNYYNFYYILVHILKKIKSDIFCQKIHHFLNELAKIDPKCQYIWNAKKMFFFIYLKMYINKKKYFHVIRIKNMFTYHLNWLAPTENTKDTKDTKDTKNTKNRNRNKEKKDIIKNNYITILYKMCINDQHIINCHLKDKKYSNNMKSLHITQNQNYDEIIKNNSDININQCDNSFYYDIYTWQRKNIRNIHNSYYHIKNIIKNNHVLYVYSTYLQFFLLWRKKKKKNYEDDNNQTYLRQYNVPLFLYKKLKKFSRNYKIISNNMIKLLNEYYSENCYIHIYSTTFRNIIYCLCNYNFFICQLFYNLIFPLLFITNNYQATSSGKEQENKYLYTHKNTCKLFVYYDNYFAKELKYMRKYYNIIKMKYKGQTTIGNHNNNNIYVNTYTTHSFNSSLKFHNQYVKKKKYSDNVLFLINEKYQKKKKKWICNHFHIYSINNDMINYTTTSTHYSILISYNKMQTKKKEKIKNKDGIIKSYHKNKTFEYIYFKNYCHIFFKCIINLIHENCLYLYHILKKYYTHNNSKDITIFRAEKKFIFSNSLKY